MPRAASCLAHGGSGDAGQPCLTAASGQVAVRLWQGGAQQGGDARRVPRFDMAHEAVLVQIGGVKFADERL